ncbi:TPA: hypothetical protein ACPSKL_000145 [Legionella anisa]
MQRRKTVNLADKKEVNELLKQLYGNNDVKDDNEAGDTERESRTIGACEVDELPPYHS